MFKIPKEIGRASPFFIHYLILCHFSNQSSGSATEKFKGWKWITSESSVFVLGKFWCDVCVCLRCFLKDCGLGKKKGLQSTKKALYIPPANHLRYLWRWINHYIIVKVHKVPGSWSNTAPTLHSSLRGHWCSDWSLNRSDWEKEKDYACQTQSIRRAGWSNVCSKSQIVSARLKRKNRRKMFPALAAWRTILFHPGSQTDRPVNMLWDE